MESDLTQPQPDDPRAVLALADQTRERLSEGLRLPTGLEPALAAAVAIQIGTAAFGIASQTVTGLVVALVGVAVFLGVAGLMLLQFRRINGVRVDGLASQIVLGTGATSTLAYLGAFAAATWAAFDGPWWVVVVLAVAGGVGYSLGIWRWWHSYRSDPVTHASGASPRVIAALAVVACVGLVVLLIASR